MNTSKIKQNMNNRNKYISKFACQDSKAIRFNKEESDDINLDDSIDKYTKAMKLVKECDEKLKNVEEQVNKIVAENGELKDFNTEEE